MANGKKTNAGPKPTPQAQGSPAEEAKVTGTAPVRRSAKSATQSTATPANAADATGSPSAAIPSVPSAASGAAKEPTSASIPPGGQTPSASSRAHAGGAGERGNATPATPAGGAGTKAATGPRRVRLTVSRLDPWSVLKFSFLISFAIGIMIVIAAGIFWLILDGMHVFTSINDTIAEIAGDTEKFNILQWVTFERTMSIATIIALIDVVVLTVLSTVFALLYNLTATLVGGVTVTLTDE